MRLLSLLILTFAVLLGISFAILNADLVTVHYYIGVQQVPLSILILSVLVLGIVIGLIVSFPTLVRLRMELRRVNRERG